MQGLIKCQLILRLKLLYPISDMIDQLQLHIIILDVLRSGEVEDRLDLCRGQFTHMLLSFQDSDMPQTLQA